MFDFLKYKMKIIIVNEKKGKEVIGFGTIDKEALDFFSKDFQSLQQFLRILDIAKLPKNIKKANKDLKERDLKPIRMIDEEDGAYYKKYNSIRPGTLAKRKMGGGNNGFIGLWNGEHFLTNTYKD